MYLLDDNPTTEDSLGFEPTAEVIVTAIKNASRRPLSIGVFGGWGSGKTSLMQMVESRLENDGIKTVWFNAWKYSGKEAVWNALIQTILLTMKNDQCSVRESQREDFKRRVISVSLGLAKYAAKVGTRFIPGGLIREEDVDEIWGAFASGVQDGSSFEFINRFEAEFGALVDEYVGDGYLVVFIDDLDRCLPENAIEILEAVKLYLDRANCVFVIGVEPSVIEAAISKRYEANASLPASMYLEKVVQLPITVPRVRTMSAIKLMSAVTDIPGFDEKQQQQFEQLIKVGMDRNPRRIKRFANALAVALSSVPACPPEELLVLAKVLLIQMRFPDFYRVLTRSAGLLQDLQRADDESAWVSAGVGRLYADRDLRRFLNQTHGISGKSAMVRRWVQATAPTVSD